MKNKKFISIVASIFVLFVIVTVIALNRKTTFLRYEKYMTNITIDAITTEEKVESTLITTKYDGSSLSIDSTSVGKESYIIGDDLYYIDGSDIFDFKTTKSYRDIYDLFASLKKIETEKKEGSYTSYSTLLSSKDVNAFLESMYFVKKTTSKVHVKLTSLNGYLDEIKLTINDIEGYKEVTINIKFIALDSSFKIDTSKLYGTTSLTTINRYKVVETKENPYEVIK